MTNDQRDLKSEYDYGQKKKFVDVLGNINNRQSTLRDLEDLKNHAGNRNMETNSRRSKFSATSNLAFKKYNSVLGKNGDLRSPPNADTESMLNREDPNG